MEEMLFGGMLLVAGVGLSIFAAWLRGERELAAWQPRSIVSTLAMHFAAAALVPCGGIIYLIAVGDTSLALRFNVFTAGLMMLILALLILSTALLASRSHRPGWAHIVLELSQEMSIVPLVYLIALSYGSATQNTSRPTIIPPKPPCADCPSLPPYAACAGEANKPTVLVRVLELRPKATADIFVSGLVHGRYTFMSSISLRLRDFVFLRTDGHVAHQATRGAAFSIENNDIFGSLYMRTDADTLSCTAPAPSLKVDIPAMFGTGRTVTVVLDLSPAADRQACWARFSKHTLPRFTDCASALTFTPVSEDRCVWKGTAVATNNLPIAVLF